MSNRTRPSGFVRWIVVLVVLLAVEMVTAFFRHQGSQELASNWEEGTRPDRAVWDLHRLTNRDRRKLPPDQPLSDRSLLGHPDPRVREYVATAAIWRRHGRQTAARFWASQPTSPSRTRALYFLKPSGRPISRTELHTLLQEKKAPPEDTR